MGRGTNIEEKSLMTNETQEADPQLKERRKRCMILIFVLGTMVFLGILFTILGLTFFKPKRIETTVNNVSIQSAETELLKLSVNVTLSIDLSIKNPNHLGFKYKQSAAYVTYKDQTIGEAPVEGGKIGKKETKNINLTMTIMADKLLRDPDAYSHARSLPLSAKVAMTGKILFMYDIEVNSHSTCDFNLDLFGGALSNLSCRSETKFN